MSVIVLVGASGSGKTTIAKAIAERFPEAVEVLFFDSIGVPSPDTMITEYGSIEGWQRSTTYEWIKRLVFIAESGRNVILEGQMRLAFLSEAASAAGLSSYTPILLDCDDATRAKRLFVDRQQPELATDDMMNWAAYLRSEALDAGCDVLKTSELSLEIDDPSFVKAPEMPCSLLFGSQSCQEFSRYNALECIRQDAATISPIVVMSSGSAARISKPSVAISAVWPTWLMTAMGPTGARTFRSPAMLPGRRNERSFRLSAGRHV